MRSLPPKPPLSNNSACMGWLCCKGPPALKGGRYAPRQWPKGRRSAQAPPTAPRALSKPFTAGTRPLTNPRACPVSKADWPAHGVTQSQPATEYRRVTRLSSALILRTYSPGILSSGFHSFS